MERINGNMYGYMLGLSSAVGRCSKIGFGDFTEGRKGYSGRSL